MFDDFRPSSTDQATRRRFGQSMAAAVVIYGSAGAAIVGATATVHKVAAETERQVQFAQFPEPPPPPPIPQAAPPKASPRPKMKRPELAAPDKIADEKLKESNKPLAPASESGPVDGFLDGVVGGTGTGPAAPPSPPPPPSTVAPPAKPALVPPVESGRNEKPRYSAAARRRGVEGTVVVAFDVLEDGSVTSPKIVSGPVELQESVLRTVLSWHFIPAHRGNEKVRFRMTSTISFHLEED